MLNFWAMEKVYYLFKNKVFKSLWQINAVLLCVFKVLYLINLSVVDKVMFYPNPSYVKDLLSQLQGLLMADGLQVFSPLGTALASESCFILKFMPIPIQAID